MTATNIVLEEMIRVLTSIREQGFERIDMDMVPDEDSPGMNKLVMHPISPARGAEPIGDEVIIRNPDTDFDRDEIYDLFKGLI